MVAFRRNEEGRFRFSIQNRAATNRNVVPQRLGMTAACGKILVVLLMVAFRRRPDRVVLVWLRRRKERFCFAWQDHCCSTTPIRLNFWMPRIQEESLRSASVNFPERAVEGSLCGF